MVHTLSTMWFPALVAFALCFFLSLILKQHPLFYPRPQLRLFGLVGLVVFAASWIVRLHGTSLAEYAGSWIGMMAGLAYLPALRRLRQLLRRALVR